MEDRTTVRHQRGIANARKCAMASVESSDVQRVTVTEGLNGEVLLSMDTSSYPAGLTPVQARVLATHLVAAADAVESRE